MILDPIEPSYGKFENIEMLSQSHGATLDMSAVEDTTFCRLHLESRGYEIIEESDGIWQIRKTVTL